MNLVEVSSITASSKRDELCLGLNCSLEMCLPKDFQVRFCKALLVLVISKQFFAGFSNIGALPTTIKSQSLSENFYF